LVAESCRHEVRLKDRLKNEFYRTPDYSVFNGWDSPRRPEFAISWVADDISLLAAHLNLPVEIHLAFFVVKRGFGRPIGPQLVFFLGELGENGVSMGIAVSGFGSE
jgi:hypothetical protein